MPMRDYWRQSRQPLTSLVFVSPLLVLYEVGVLVLGRSAIRNGADAWLRLLLDWLGLGSYFLLPVLTAAALLAWHHLQEQPWRVRPRVLQAMALESILLAIGLVLVVQTQAAMLDYLGMSSRVEPAHFGDSAMQAIGKLVGFFGAGVYEEVLFRLLMLPAVAWLISRCGAGRWPSLIGAILVTSLLFSAAHHVGQFGEALRWQVFLMRLVAGAWFALLFVLRGFGIAAASHALYDVFVGLDWP